MRKYHDRMIALLALAAIAAVVAGSLMTIDALRSETRLEVARAQARYEDAQAQVDKLAARELLPEGMEARYIGNFKCSSYCTERTPHICGTGDGITASGAPVTAGLTIAVDPDLIPLGSVVYIEGIGVRVAQDIGGAVQGYCIDVAVEGSHEDALRWPGYGYHEVWLLGGDT